MVDRSSRDDAVAIVWDDDVHPVETRVVPHHAKDAVLFQNKRSGKVTTLKLDDSNHQSLLPLIDFIDPKLLSVELLGRYGDLITVDFLRQLLAAYPNLEDLQFGTPEENLMTVFTEAYERGECKIESLNIEDLKIGQVEALVAFIRMLQEPTSAAAKSLRFLGLRNPPLTPPHFLLDEDVFTAFAEMLHVNRTLEYLDVHMNETLTDGFEAELMSFDKQIIGWRLPSPKRRYAFLSVLQHFAALSQTTEPPPRKCPRPTEGHTRSLDHGSELERTIILAIFEFAAETVTRQVCVRTLYMP